MVKDYVWELSDNNEKVVVKYFSGSTTEDMMTWIKPRLKRNPDRFIIHVRTNDLRSDQENIEVANNSKTDTNKVLISSIVRARDNLNGKGRQVNSFLKEFCMENDFVYLNNGNIKPRQQCNHGGIHLDTLSMICLIFLFLL